MLSSELKINQCLRITEGTGNTTMHLIKGDNCIYVSQNSTLKRVCPSKDKDQQFIYEHFAFKTVGELADTKTVVNEIRSKSKDWYTLLLCEMICRNI